ncbi:hypothetical protein BH18ACT17_BH18ACT17_11190 [soil metagenome]
MLEPALDAILRSVPGWADDEFDVVPLEGRLTNRNYVVTVAGTRYVLRVPGHDTELLGIDRANEHRAAVVAAESGVGPEVVAFRPTADASSPSSSRAHTCRKTSCARARRSSWWTHR